MSSEGQGTASRCAGATRQWAVYVCVLAGERGEGLHAGVIL